VEDTYGKSQCCPLVHSGVPIQLPATPDRARYITLAAREGFDPDQSWKVAGEAIRMGARTRPDHPAERQRAPVAGRACARPGGVRAARQRVALVRRRSLKSATP